MVIGVSDWVVIGGSDWVVIGGSNWVEIGGTNWCVWLWKLIGSGYVAGDSIIAVVVVVAAASHDISWLRYSILNYILYTPIINISIQ